jgi:hypothetical protein
MGKEFLSPIVNENYTIIPMVRLPLLRSKMTFGGFINGYF